MLRGTLRLGGFVPPFGLFGPQAWNASRRADALELEDLERLVTQRTIKAHLASSVVGVAALACQAGGRAGASGPVFWAMGPPQGSLGLRHDRAAHAQAEEMGIVFEGEPSARRR